MDNIKFIEWLLYNSDFSYRNNGRNDYWFTKNDVEDAKDYTLEEVYEWWKINKLL